MKYIDILKAQKRYEEIGESIRELMPLRGKIVELQVHLNDTIDGYRILEECNRQLQDEIEKLRKERKEMEV